MPARMRLQRYGKKGQPYYHIVIADGRAPRDGRFIELIGTYNPLTKPADIKINFEKALQWLKNGAEPSETVRAILSYKGILYKYHLLKGVNKGAMTEEQAEARFQEWAEKKESKINSHRKEVELAGKTEEKKRHEHEIKINTAKAEAVQKKLMKAMAAAAEQHEEAEAVTEAMAEEIAEAVAVRESEVPVAETITVPETPASEPDAPITETVMAVETPAAEPEAPVAETDIASETKAAEPDAPSEA